MTYNSPYTTNWTNLGLPEAPVSCFNWREMPVIKIDGMKEEKPDTEPSTPVERNRIACRERYRAKQNAKREGRGKPIPEITSEMDAAEKQRIRNRQSMRIRRGAERVNPEGSQAYSRAGAA